MNKTTQLKKLLLQRKALPCPGVYDALSARMVEYCGFQACQISGFGVSASQSPSVRPEWHLRWG